MKRLGATVVDPVDFNGAIAEVMAAYEPSFFTQIFPEAIPAGTEANRSHGDDRERSEPLPNGVRGVNLRMVAGPPRGEEGKYAINLYLKERGDAKFRSVEDMFAPRRFQAKASAQGVFGAKATPWIRRSVRHALRMQTCGEFCTR